MTLDYSHQTDWTSGFGQQQSPIRLSGEQAEFVGTTELTVLAPYQMTQERDDGTTIKLLGTGGVRLGTQDYHCVQVHFHAPNEHVTDATSGFEVHFVHQTSIGQLCVVAALFTLGAANQTLAEVIAHFDADQHPVDLDLTALMPAHGRGYHYLGSLTTPPLSEGVEWYVLEGHGMTVSAEQAAWFTRRFEANNRGLQPVAHRRVERFNF